MQLLRNTAFALFLGALAAAPLAGTAYAQSSESARDVVSESRPVEAGIVRVNVMGPVDLKLRAGATPSLTLRGERRVLQEIATDREGTTLKIQPRSSFNTKSNIVAELTLPKLEAVRLMGSGDAEISGFSGEQFKLDMMGSGDVRADVQYQELNAGLKGSGDLKLTAGNSERVELSIFGSGGITASGKAKAMTAKIMGTGGINARQLVADSTTVSIFGTGDAQVFAGSTVAVSSRGTGDVLVYGKPTQRAVSISGTGNVKFQP